MSAATLSPAEQDEVARIGIHDEDVIADLEGHGDEAPVCTVCSVPAAARAVKTCCRDAYLTCDRHLRAWRVSIDNARNAQCGVCGRVWIAPRFDDVFMVVPL